LKLAELAERPRREEQFTGHGAGVNRSLGIFSDLLASLGGYFTDADSMPTKSSPCPHCGLVLIIKPDKTETRLRFAVKEWERLCKYVHLGSPVMCLLQDASAASLDEK